MSKIKRWAAWAQHLDLLMAGMALHLAARVAIDVSMRWAAGSKRRFHRAQELAERERLFDE